jgi:hypothetical protein
MNLNSGFLSHLRLSSEAIKDWPAWKTDMWAKPDQTESTNDLPSDAIKSKYLAIIKRRKHSK